MTLRSLRLPLGLVVSLLSISAMAEAAPLTASALQRSPDAAVPFVTALVVLGMGIGMAAWWRELDRARNSTAPRDVDNKEEKTWA